MLAPPPFDAPIAVYEEKAAELLSAFRAKVPAAIRAVHCSHPRFLDEKVPWLERRMSADEVAAAAFDLDDARLAAARLCGFLDWPSLESYARTVADPASDAHRFERAVEAVVDGELEVLRQMLADDLSLVHARSARVTHFDPAVHRATLLHYVAANGVEGHRQRTPPNAVDIARTLLDAGAEVDSLAALYGGEWPTLGLLVSSSHPKDAGLQVPLTELLLDYGAAIDGLAADGWGQPLRIALVFGCTDAADVLVRRGARVDVVAAAGLGRASDVAAQLAASTADDRHRALALAAQLGHVDAVRLLLDAGEDPDRFNPPKAHAHATPLHHAALGGHVEVVRLMIERGARLDIEDSIWKSTPLGWANYNHQEAAAAMLRAAGAPGYKDNS